MPEGLYPLVRRAARSSNCQQMWRLLYCHLSVRQKTARVARLHGSFSACALGSLAAMWTREYA